MVKVDIGPWRSSGKRIFSASLIGVPDLCFHDSSACGLDRDERWFLCQPLQSPDIFEAHFATDTAEDERALTARVGDAGGKVQFVGLITGVCSVYMWLLRSSDPEGRPGRRCAGRGIRHPHRRDHSRAQPPQGVERAIRFAGDNQRDRQCGWKTTTLYRRRTTPNGQDHARRSQETRP